MGEREPARLVIADDHYVVRTGLRLVLATQPDFEVVGEAESGRGALELCRTLRPDLVLMDVSMPEMDGLEATRAIKAELPTPGVRQDARAEHYPQAQRIGPDAGGHTRREFRHRLGRAEDAPRTVAALVAVDTTGMIDSDNKASAVRSVRDAFTSSPLLSSNVCPQRAQAGLAYAAFDLLADTNQTNEQGANFEDVALRIWGE